MAELGNKESAFSKYREKESEDDESDAGSGRSETNCITTGLAGMVLRTPNEREVASSTARISDHMGELLPEDSRDGTLKTLVSLIQDLTSKTESMHDDLTSKTKSMHDDLTSKTESMHDDLTSKTKSMHDELKADNAALREEFKLNNERIQVEIQTWKETLSQEVSQMNRNIGEVETRCEIKIDETARKVREQCREVVISEVGYVKVRTEVLEKNVEEVVATQKSEQDSFKARDEKIKSLENEIVTLKEKGITSQVVSVPAQSFTKPSFSALSHEHPIAFIKEVHYYFSVVNIPHALQPQVFFQMLEGDAKTWGKSLFPLPATLAECKEKFLSNFWDADTQYNFRMHVITGKYVRTKMNTMKQFATEKVALARLCSPPMSEGEIIYSLIRQFPINVQNMLKSVEQLTVDRLIMLLGLYDQTYQSSAPPVGNANPQGSQHGSSNTRPSTADNEYRVNSVTFKGGRGRGNLPSEKQSSLQPHRSGSPLNQEEGLNSRRLV
ncbi:uncharacterized protein LOC124154983 [Ischnura elegans]|uniref:uncharacterized protein LOC124154983 n=1 Tax=Ischnura elegans TaxID=197161 RepID=UPI001ED876E0|nr:uncharacterized protein LOC124154983 [Ischnura elegans]